MSSSSASPSSTSSTDFASLPLNPAVLANLTQLGYTSMTPIQAASLPVALLGKDLIAQAKTGSGTGAISWALGTGSTAPGAAINASSGAVTSMGAGTVVIAATKAADANCR